jgi:hypothetical protein
VVANRILFLVQLIFILNTFYYFGRPNKTVFMKTFLLALFVFASTSLFAQNTTQEEYNFMTKGFQQLIESGLDMKKGYHVADTLAFTTQGQKYEFYFLNLVRDKDKSLAGTIVVAISKVWNKRYYLGMTAAQSDNSIDHERDLMVQISNYAWDVNIKTAFLQALSEYLSLNMTKNYQSKRNT